MVTMKEPSTSHAGRAREEGRASPHMRVWLGGLAVKGQEGVMRD